MQFPLCPGLYLGVTNGLGSSNIIHFSNIFRPCFAEDKNVELLSMKTRKNNPEGHKLLKKYVALSLLPVSKIRSALNDLIDVTHAQFGDSKGWIKFIDYFERQWMKIAGPDLWSVYRKVDRTNNFVESYHRSLNLEMKTYPAWVTFISKYFPFFLIKQFLILI